MSAVALLLGLLVVAYVGGHLMGGKASSYRLASGGEYLLLGIALGPYALGFAERSTLHAFQPVAVIATAWLTLVIGVDYGYREGRRVTLRGLATGIVLALISGASTGAAVYFAARRFTSFAGNDLLVVAAGAGLAACETTRHAVRWVVGRHGASGNLSRLISDLADSDDLVPILGMAAVFPFVDPPQSSLVFPWWVWACATPLFGAVLGGTAAALLRAEPRAGDGWGVLLGAALLGTGIASRLGLAPQMVTFALGVTLSIASRHRAELRAMLAGSEQTVLLPMLLLAGAELEIHGARGLLVILAAAMGARALVRFVAAPVLATMASVSRGVAPALAVGLLPTGALSIALGLAFVSRYPGLAGDAVLAVSVLLALLGEVVGPAALRRALTSAGEIDPTAGAPASEVPSESVAAAGGPS